MPCVEKHALLIKYKLYVNAFVAEVAGLKAALIPIKSLYNASKMIAQRNISAPSNVTIDDDYKIVNDIVRKSWQCYWDDESKGRYTYHLIPSVGT